MIQLQYSHVHVSTSTTGGGLLDRRKIIHGMHPVGRKD